MTLEEHIGQTHIRRAVPGYLRTINLYLKYIGSQADSAIYMDVVNYIGVLRKKGMHSKTIRNHLYGIKMYYQWLVDTGQRDDHPCRDFYLKDKVNKAIPVETLYSKKELEELLKTHRAKMPLVRNRDKIILSLLVRQAITVTEIIYIKISDLNLQEATLILPGTSRTMARKLPLRADQIMLINEYLTKTRPLLIKNNKNPSAEGLDTLILSRRGNRMKPISISGMFCEPMANGHKITPQKVRQSVIANMLKSGEDLRVIQAFTGHKRISSIEQYRQTGLEELKTIINKYHPIQ